MIRPMTPDENVSRETIIDHSATQILAKLWATMWHLQDLVGISRSEIAGWSINYKGRLNHQPETNFASDIMSRLRRELTDYPRAWDQHAVDAITPEHVSFDRELLNADVRARVETCLSVHWREVGMMQRARESEKCDG